MDNSNSVLGIILLLFALPWTILEWRNIFRGNREPPISEDAVAGALVTGANAHEALRAGAFIGCFAPIIAPALVVLALYLLSSSP